jgi:hypothetical protein
VGWGYSLQNTDPSHAVLDGSGDITIPGLRHKLSASPFRREIVVCRHEEGRRTTSRHESRRLEIVGVVANNDAEREISNLKDRYLAASLRE